MANIKNFGIVGVGSSVQFGKGGAQLIQTAGTFAAKNAQGNAFVRFQIADGESAGDAVTFQQHTNAVTAINSNVAAVSSDLSNTNVGAGLGVDGAYTAPVESNYLANATTLNDADGLLDAAIKAEADRATAAEAGLASDLANALANSASLQGELDTVEASVGLATDGSLTLAAGNYLANAVDLVSAIETLDGAIADVSGVATNAAADVATLTTTVGDLSNAVASTDSNVSTLSGRVDTVEANTVALQGLTTDLRTDVDANSAILTDTVANVASLDGRVTALENNDDLANAIAELTQDVSDEANARSDADTLINSNVATVANSVAQEITDRANAVADEANTRATADTAMASDIANAAAAVVQEVSDRANAVSDEANARSAADTVLTSDLANTTADLATLSANAVLKDGSVAMTGALDLGNNAIHNVADPVADSDAATAGWVNGKIAVLGNAFNYVGTLAGGADANSATDLSTLDSSGQDAGDYYKVTTAGYFVQGADIANAAYFNINDGLVFNTNGGFDKIDNTDASTAGTTGEITVSGSVDVGFVVGIDGAYTTARQAEVAVVANSVAQEVSDRANAISDEANTRATADTAMASDISNAAAAVVQEASDRANAVSDEANARSSADTAMASDIANAVAAVVQEVSDRANAVTDEANARIAADAVLTSDLANTDANAVTLEGRVTALENNDDLANAIAELTQDISDEANTRADADTVLTGNLANTDANVATVAANLANTDANVATVASDLSNAVTSISDEANTRAAADTVLTGAVANTDANVATVASDLANAQTEINLIEAAAGLDSDGNYVANTGSNYLANATSLANSDDLLDNAVAALATELANLSQDTIKTSDSLNSVHVSDDAITMSLNVGNVATVVANVIASANTNTNLSLDFGTADEVVLAAHGTSDDVDLRLAAQGAGHVIIGETGVGVIQADSGYEMTVAGGSGANLNLLGSTVVIGEEDGTSVAQFTGVVGATAYATVANGNTAVTFGAAGSASNLDLVFAPKGTGSVNVSNAKIINVANATLATDAVNKGQLDTALATVSVGVVKTVVATLPATSGDVTLGTITGTVLRVRVLVTNAYDAGSTITVGNSTTANDLAAEGDIDESAASIYVIETAKDYSAVTVTATVTNATGENGAAKVIVEYLSA